MTIVLRPYAVQDRTALIRVIDEVCGEGRWMGTAWFESTPAWERALQQAPCDDLLLLLAADGSAVVGWCRVFPETGAQQADASLGVGLLAPYRNRRIGSGLVQQALSWAWSAGLQRVTLKTRLDNWRALRVFLRCGFEFLPGTDEIWVDMACFRLRWQRPSFAALAMLHTMRPTPISGELGSERAWL